MNTSAKHLYELHETHKEWLSRLKFYSDEILHMVSGISEIASKNSSKELSALVEQYQNRLIIEKEQLDILAHMIREEEKSLEASVRNNPVAVDHRSFPDNVVLRVKMETFEKMFAELRGHYQQFLART